MSENPKFIIVTTKSWNIHWADSIHVNINNRNEFVMPCYWGRSNCSMPVIKNIPEVYKEWSKELVYDKKQLTIHNLTCSHKPKYVFFPHWSWKIPEEIYGNLECIAFHMTDLPFGRGGSPLQNLIVRGVRYTQITAFRVTKEVDAGPIYLKHPLSLEGTANQILQRASDCIFRTMIPYILTNKINPIEQQGKPIVFKRRMPAKGNLSGLKKINKVYDYIRMLDGEGYPPAFLETEKLKLEFTEAELKAGEVEAKVKIKVK